ncbi:hypothetical protein PCASD_03717 [Puccinia coronata f. sp. avenae]|uniref:Uncharacterized protein n=1 Tax=Puccinia coronata f. sp. avenae TaxID=200324 RepID=A0A2N5V9N5_9BASI|nr:hypothetical protein PCASD_12945 [Puccinia coronata f. sp. avenae]PLW46695.1 hypothetical protein PCASD_03717 [Puccinia coronata f. sp. avenae]
MSAPASDKSLDEEGLEKLKTDSKASSNGGFTEAQWMCYQEHLVRRRRLLLLRNEHLHSNANPTENQPTNQPNDEASVAHPASSPNESGPSSISGSSEGYLSGGSPIREWWDDDQRNAAIRMKAVEKANWEEARDLRKIEAEEADHATGVPTPNDNIENPKNTQQGSSSNLE